MEETASSSASSVKSFFNLLQWAVRAILIPIGGITLNSGKLTYICIRDNLTSALPFSILMTLISFAGLMIAIYGGFYIESEDKPARGLDEESVKSCILDRLRTLLSSFTFLSFSIMTVIIVIFAFVEPYKLHWDSFYPALIATFLGVFLGYTLDRMFSLAQEKATINKILESILKELEMNLKDLTEWEFESTAKYFSRSSNAVFMSAIGGGYLSLMEVELQEKLSRLYSNIDFITYKSDRILRMALEKPQLIEANTKLQTDLYESVKEHQEVIKYLRARVSLKR